MDGSGKCKALVALHSHSFVMTPLPPSLLLPPSSPGHLVSYCGRQQVRVPFHIWNSVMRRWQVLSASNSIVSSSHWIVQTMCEYTPTIVSLVCRSVCIAQWLSHNSCTLQTWGTTIFTCLGFLTALLAQYHRFPSGTTAVLLLCHRHIMVRSPSTLQFSLHLPIYGNKEHLFNATATIRASCSCRCRIEVCQLVCILFTTCTITNDCGLQNKAKVAQLY